jgi:zinc transporter, ZIP family
VLEAAFYAVVGASSLVLGAILVYAARPNRQVIGCIMAFGAGALISAVSFELVLDVTEKGRGVALAGGLAGGAITFYLGDAWIDARGGGSRKRSTGQQESGSALAITFGTLLDGVPESFILGLTLVAGGGVSWAFLAAVAVSNLPEAMAATYGLDEAGWRRNNVIWMWIGLTVVSGVSGALGFAAFSAMPSSEGALIQAFAAGALLTMLADTMMPEAFDYAGRTVGLFTVLGFGVSIALSTLE